MENYYINKSTKYLQIFSCFKNGELNQTKNIKIQYDSIEKFTLLFQNEEENITLYGNKKFREDFDDFKECLSLILFGNKNEILSFYKDKRINLEEIKFSNCSYYKKMIEKYILDDIEATLPSYFRKDVKLSFID